MKQWYVVQVYAGYEELARADLRKRIEEAGLTEHFGEILVPSAKMKQLFTDDSQEQDQQLFPGYMLIEMEPVPEAIRLVMITPRISRFLGGVNPVPLAQREIERIRSQMRGEVAIAVEKSQFEVGREVEIKEGVFAGFTGIVDSIDEDNEKMTVMVSIFGRMTPIELGFDQVKG